MNTNQFLLNINNPNITKFLQAELLHCKQHKVSVKLLKKTVEINGVECSGYFTDSPRRQIIVNVDRPIEEWLPVFVHESCHKDQFLENSNVWTDKIDEYFDAGDIFDMYLASTVELTNSKLQEVIGQIVAVELDCERRSLDKIKTYNLPIDTDEYAQKANAYIYSHFAIAKKRQFGRDAAYSIPEIWKKMPVDFDQDYSKINSKLFKLYDSNFW